MWLTVVIESTLRQTVLQAVVLDGQLSTSLLTSRGKYVLLTIDNHSERHRGYRILRRPVSV
jgi:hypothetical protein